MGMRVVMVMVVIMAVVVVMVVMMVIVINLGALRLVQLGIGIDAANARLDVVEFVRRDEVGLVDQDHIGESNLIFCFRRVLEPLIEPFGVGHGHNGVELGLAADFLVNEEGLRDRRRIGEAGCFDDDGV